MAQQSSVSYSCPPHLALGCWWVTPAAPAQVQGAAHNHSLPEQELPFYPFTFAQKCSFPSPADGNFCQSIVCSGEHIQVQWFRCRITSGIYRSSPVQFLQVLIKSCPHKAQQRSWQLSWQRASKHKTVAHSLHRLQHLVTSQMSVTFRSQEGHRAVARGGPQR